MRCHEIAALTVLRAGPLTIGQVEVGEYSMARKSRQIVEGIISAIQAGCLVTRKEAAGDTCQGGQGTLCILWKTE